MDDNGIIQLYWDRNDRAISATSEKYGYYCKSIAKEDFFEVLGELDDDIVEEVKTPAKKPFNWKIWGATAACMALLVSLSGIAFAAEAEEYHAAVVFFEDNGLSMEGLSRSDVKAVYRDITTQHFTYDKTAEVIQQIVPGLEISQREPTPEELAAAWNRNVWTNTRLESGIRYSIDYQEKPDESLGFDVLDKSILNCYQNDIPLWAAEFPDFLVEDGLYTAAGTVAWGRNDTWSSEQITYSSLALVDEGGTILWQRRLNHGFQHEYVEQVLDNGDGTWAVVGRGDHKYLCLSQYDTNGNELTFHQTEVGNLGIWNAARLGDGYLVQLGNTVDGETARVVKLDHEGNLIDNFTYAGENCDYHLTSMEEFGGRVYLSAYAVPKQINSGGRYEIANVLDYVFEKENWEISSEELTPLVRDNYTAVLLLCNPEGGVPETFYSVSGSLGGKLNVNDAGELVWEVESVVNTFFSPATSSFTIGGTCQVFCYTFDDAGTLLSQEDTGETVPYRR